MQQMICDITEPADPLGTGSLRLWDSLRDRNISIPLGAFSVDFCAFNKPADFYDTVTGEFKNFANVPPAGFRWLHQVPPAGFTRQLRSSYNRSDCESVDDPSDHAVCGGNYPIPACCYEASDQCDANDDGAGGQCNPSDSLAGCCPA